MLARLIFFWAITSAPESLCRRQGQWWRAVPGGSFSRFVQPPRQCRQLNSRRETQDGWERHSDRPRAGADVAMLCRDRFEAKKLTVVQSRLAFRATAPRLKALTGCSRSGGDDCFPLPSSLSPMRQRQVQLNPIMRPRGAIRPHSPRSSRQRNHWRRIPQRGDQYRQTRGGEGRRPFPSDQGGLATTRPRFADQPVFRRRTTLEASRPAAMPCKRSSQERNTWNLRSIKSVRT